MKINILRQNSLALLSAPLLILTSCSSPPPSAPEASISAVTQTGVPGGIFVTTLDVSARVTAIDYAKRTATLVDSHGKKFPIKVGPDAVNFAQVKVGDLVNATVVEEVVAYLAEAGAPPTDGSAALVVLAPEGAKPGGVIADTVEFTATITALDLKHHRATLQFPDGSERQVAVRKDVDLSQRKVGEAVVIRITEMLALRVEKPQ